MSTHTEVPRYVQVETLSWPEKPTHNLPGPVVVVGGKEKKFATRGKTDGLSPNEIANRRPIILEYIAEWVKERDGLLLVSHAASEVPEEYWKDYKLAFERLGLKNRVYRLRSWLKDTRSDTIQHLKQNGKLGIYFGGGSQKLATSVLTPQQKSFVIESNLFGGLVGGTSAGAAMTSRTMLMPPERDTQQYSLGEGLGFLPYAIIDQHFRQRNRLARLESAVRDSASNGGPWLGIGVDENTAFVMRTRLDHENNLQDVFEVMGENAVTFLDYRRIVASPQGSFASMIQHELKHGDRFHLQSGTVEIKLQ